uniref:SCP domain-containing protein n=1 Tax=Glossina pallidipes TaxID=7398 RepID=A0A1B0AB29_GLOPL
MDRTSRIGCAISVCRKCAIKPGERSNFCYFFACNYDFSPQNDSFVYLYSESPGSGCHQWKTTESKTYPNLCAGNGTLFIYATSTSTTTTTRAAKIMWTSEKRES